MAMITKEQCEMAVTVALDTAKREGSEVIIDKADVDLSEIDLADEAKKRGLSVTLGQKKVFQEDGQDSGAREPVYILQKSSGE
jgi:hypothetical protein